MSNLAFDAAGFVRFDLVSGTIRSIAEESLALVPADLLSLLEPSADLDSTARAWGECHGKRLSRVLTTSDEPGSIALLADHLGGALTVAGLGSLTIEIRGDALMFRVSTSGGTPVAAGRQALVAGFLAGFLGAIGPGGFGVIHLGDDNGDDLFWAGNPNAARQVHAWLEQGIAPMTALDRLATGGAA